MKETIDLQVKQKDFPELEGKEILYKESRYESYQCIVAGCNYDIGISIVTKDDNDEYALCFAGPLAPQGKDVPEDLRKEEMSIYEDLFYFTVESIKSGTVDATELGDYIYEALGHSNIGGGTPIAEDCPFGN